MFNFAYDFADGRICAYHLKILKILKIYNNP